MCSKKLPLNLRRQLSAITVFLLALGAIARIFTSIQVASATILDKTPLESSLDPAGDWRPNCDIDLRLQQRGQLHHRPAGRLSQNTPKPVIDPCMLFLNSQWMGEG